MTNAPLQCKYVSGSYIYTKQTNLHVAHGAVQYGSPDLEGTSHLTKKCAIIILLYSRPLNFVKTTSNQNITFYKK